MMHLGNTIHYISHANFKVRISGFLGTCAPSIRY